MTTPLRSRYPSRCCLVLVNMCYGGGTQRYNDAIHSYGRAIQLDATYLSAYTNRGYAHRKLGMFEKAVEDYTQALEIDPGNIKTHNNRGYSYAKQNRFREAIMDYTKVIELDPLNAHAYHNRGISYDKLGNFEKAIADFTKVLCEAGLPQLCVPPTHVLPNGAWRLIPRDLRVLARSWSWSPQMACSRGRRQPVRPYSSASLR